MACFTVSLAVLAAQSALALAYGFVLMIAIVIYNIIHAQHATAVILMGLCRGLVYVTAALAAGGSMPWGTLALLSSALMLYVLLFSLVARGEAGERRTRFEEIIVLAPMFAVVLGEFVSSPAPAWMTILGRGLFLLWTLGIAVSLSSPRRNLGRAVGWWIAGIALLDLYHLTRLNEPAAAGVAFACFVLTLAGQRWIAGS
jgi:4-hydroxybenzoate polyprenyltransferase